MSIYFYCEEIETFNVISGFIVLEVDDGKIRC